MRLVLLAGKCPPVAVVQRVLDLLALGHEQGRKSCDSDIHRAIVGRVERHDGLHGVVFHRHREAGRVRQALRLCGGNVTLRRLFAVTDSPGTIRSTSTGEVGRRRLRASTTCRAVAHVCRDSG